MSDRITLPGTIPGLLRPGSPAIVLGVPGLVVVGRDGGGDVLGWTVARADGLCRVAQPSDVVLDLTDATGRAHAAWWVFRRSPAIEAAGSLWLSQNQTHTRELAWHYLGAPQGERRRMVAIQPEAVVLEGLDPNDPRLLPDGSRWVDAEALRRVVLHVAGLEAPNV